MIRNQLPAMITIEPALTQRDQNGNQIFILHQDNLLPAKRCAGHLSEVFRNCTLYSFGMPAIMRISPGYQMAGSIPVA